jgi:hypothetical protein
MERHVRVLAVGSAAAWAAALLLSAACGHGGSGAGVLNNEAPPDAGQDVTEADGSPPPGDSGAGASDVAAGDHSSDGAGDGTTTDAGKSDAAPPPPPEDGSPPPISTCMPADGWSTLTRVASIASTGFDVFGSVSGGGTTVAWTTSAGAVYVADRASATDSFGTPAQVSTGATQLSTGRVALDVLGLKLVATLASGKSFVAFVRASTSSAWVQSQTNEFNAIATIEGGPVVSNPVLSGDGQALYYILQLGTNAPVLVESPWDPTTKQWGVGNDLTNPEFQMTSASQLRRPTGAASDRQTLFFFDEMVGHERAAYRNSPGQDFDYFQDLPNVPEAAPIDDCLTLYFHGMDASGQGLFTAQ